MSLVWIAGISGAGKTSVGKIVQVATGWRLLDSDDPAMKPLLGASTEETTNILLRESGGQPAICCCLALPALPQVDWLLVGLRVPITVAMQRKPAGYGRWTGIPDRSWGRALDSWDGLHRAELILDATRPIYENARFIVESMRDAGHLRRP